MASLPEQRARALALQTEKTNETVATRDYTLEYRTGMGASTAGSDTLNYRPEMAASSTQGETMQYRGRWHLCHDQHQWTPYKRPHSRTTHGGIAIAGGGGKPKPSPRTEGGRVLKSMAKESRNRS